jgi:hypothetical protein
MGTCKAYLYCSALESGVQKIHFDNFFKAFPEDVGISDDIYVVAASSETFNKLIHPAWLPTNEQKRWECFHRKIKSVYLQFCKAQSLASAEKLQTRDLFCFSWPEPGFADLKQPISKSRLEGEKQYIALITTCPEDLSYLTIWGCLFFLATKWHVEQGGLSLHSAAVARGDDGFLFLGRSKAGKSTIAELSASIGLSALGDDLNFIINDKNNGYRLAASASPSSPRRNYSFYQPKLRGIFLLIQDKSDYLSFIPPMKLAPLLFDSFIQQTPYVRRVADNLVTKGFQTICDLARQVPSYELHFRKSPDFWKLIDEKFPR